MGTIGDLLGIDLAAAFGQDTPEASDLDEAQEEAHAAGVPVNDDSLQAQMGQREQKPDAEGANPRHEAVLAAIVAETNLEPSRARLDLTLAGDLDLDDLGLYGVVAAIEHELRLSFADEHVRSWQTLGDILNAVDAAENKN